MRAELVAARRPDRLSPALLRSASDECLVEHVRAGSTRAFEVLFDRHRAPVLAFCRRMLGSREEAEDAVQQTFVAAYRELLRADQPPDLRPWLYGIARYRCLSALRAGRSRAFAEIPERGGTDHVVGDVTMREDLRAVLADVSRLPEDQRAALVLAELCDLSHAEIAPIVGCSRNKVKALVFQARSSLSVEREARETPCGEIREQLKATRGGALRRSVLRRHLRECPGCCAFRETLRSERRRLRLLLPLSPVIGLKGVLLGPWLGGGGGAATAGTAVTAGGFSVAGVAATAALVTVAIPALALTDGPAGTRGAAPPAVTVGAEGHGPAPADAPTRIAALQRAVPRPAPDRATRPGRSAVRGSERRAPSAAHAADTVPAPPGRSDVRARPEQAPGGDPIEPSPPDAIAPTEVAKPDALEPPGRPPPNGRTTQPERSNGSRPDPARPPASNGQDPPGKPPARNGRDAAAEPPAWNGRDVPATQPGSNQQAAPARPDHQPPPGEGAPAPSHDPGPSPASVRTPGAADGGADGREDHARSPSSIRVR